MPWDSFFDIGGFDRLSRIFDDAMSGRGRAADATAIGAWTPRVDIAETDDSLLFEVEAPGVSHDAVEVEMIGDRLTVRGERRPAAGREYLRMERAYGPFQRSFVIGTPVVPGAAEAQWRDGVLEIRLPKVKPADGGPSSGPVESPR